MAGRNKSASDFLSTRLGLQCHSFLGGGSFGDTFKVSENCDKLVAIKQVSIENYKKLFRSEEFPLDKILREIDLLKKLTSCQNGIFHENIVEYYSHWIEGPDKDDRKKLNSPLDFSDTASVLESNWLFIQMAFCNSGDLRSWMRTYPSQSLRPPQIVRSFMSQILSALTFIHELGIVHRDLTPANIFLHENSIKLGDFGLGRELRDEYSAVTTVELGTFGYRSPEMLKGDGKYGEKTDVFSASLICLELMLPQGSVEGLNNLRVEVLNRLQIPDGTNVFDKICSQEWNTELRLVEKMSAFDQTQRFSSSQAYERLINPEIFLQELETEERIAKILWWKVPATTWAFFGRNDELLQVDDSTGTGETVFIEGRFLIGKTELVNNFVHRHRERRHCIWLECGDGENRLLACIQMFLETRRIQIFENDSATFCQALQQILDLDTTFSLTVVIDNATAEDYSTLLPIVEFFRDNPSLSLIIISRTSQLGDDMETDEIKIHRIILSELNLRESCQMLSNRLAPYFPIESEKRLGDMSELLHHHPGLITAFGSFVKENQSGPFPFSSASALQFLEDSSEKVFSQDFKGRTILKCWKDFCTEISPEAIFILQILVICYSQEDHAGERTVIDVCETLSKGGNLSESLKENGKFDPEKVTEAILELHDCHLISMESHNADTFDALSRVSYEVILIPPLFRQLVRKDLSDNVEKGKEFMKIMMSVRHDEGLEHCQAMQLLLSDVWEWVITESKSDWLIDASFRETSIKLIETCGFIPLAKFKEKDDLKMFTKLNSIVKLPFQDDYDYTVHILHCHRVIIWLRKSLNSVMGQEAFLKLKELRSIQRPTSIYSPRLQEMLLNQGCLLSSLWMVRFPDLIPLSTVRNWILEELNGPQKCKIGQGIEFTLIAFLSCFNSDKAPSLIAKKELTKIGEAMIEKYLHIETKRREDYLPMLMIFMVLLNDVNTKEGTRNDKYEDERESLARFQKMIRKIEKILSLNPVKNGIALCTWIDTLGEEGINWWCEALIRTASRGLPFLCNVLNLLLQWNLKFSIEFFPFFRQVLGKYEKGNILNDQAGHKLRFQNVLENVHRFAESRTLLCHYISVIGASKNSEVHRIHEGIQALIPLYFLNKDSDLVAEDLIKQRDSTLKVSENDDLELRNGSLKWLSRSERKSLPLKEVRKLAWTKASEILDSQIDDLFENIENVHILWPLLYCLNHPNLQQRHATFHCFFEKWIMNCKEEEIIPFLVHSCQFLGDFLLCGKNVLEVSEKTLFSMVKRGFSHEKYVKPIISCITNAIRIDTMNSPTKLLALGGKLLPLANDCDIKLSMMDFSISILNDTKPKMPNPENQRTVTLNLIKRWLDLNPKVKLSAGKGRVTEASFNEEGKKIFEAFVKVGIGEIFSLEMGIIILALITKEGLQDLRKPALKKIFEHTRDSTTSLLVLEEMQNWVFSERNYPNFEDCKEIHTFSNCTKSLEKIYEDWVKVILDVEDIVENIDATKDENFFVI